MSTMQIRNAKCQDLSVSVTSQYGIRRFTAQTGRFGKILLGQCPEEVARTLKCTTKFWILA